MKFLDTTLRDGNQAIRERFRPLDQQDDLFVRYAEAASRFGMDYLEAGIPIASKQSEWTVRRIADVHRDRTKTTVLAFSRARPQEIDLAADCIQGSARHGIALLTSVSDLQLHKFGNGETGDENVLSKRSRMLDVFRRAVEHAASHQLHELLVYLEDSTRADRQYLLDLCQAYIEGGATTISVPDTVGHVNDPEDYAKLLQFLRENTPGSERVQWSAHCHNDRDLAVATTLLVMKRRLVEVVEGTINGRGERCGNTNLTSVLLNVFARGTSHYPPHCRKEGLELGQLTQLHTLGCDVLSTDPTPYEPLVGACAHKTAAGLHQDGTLKHRDMFRSYDPAVFGVTNGSPFVFSDQSGRKGLAAILSGYGVQLDGTALDKAYADAVKIATLLQGKVPDSLLRATAWEAQRNSDPRRVELGEMNLEHGKNHATVRGTLLLDAQTEACEGKGDGPTSAFVTALSELLKRRFGVTVDVEEWFERAATHEQGTEGREAVVWAFVRLLIGEERIDGYASNPNATQASFLACLQAVNRWLSEQPYSPKHHE